MKTIENLIQTKDGGNALIIGAGSSIKKFQQSIKDFIKGTNPFTIGINNMTEYFIPNYHLWTNTSRFRTYGKNINKHSNLLLGSNISLKVIKDIIGSREYTLINYEDKEKTNIGYKNGKLLGYYRTAGCLAIMISHIMGANEIFIIGMDGYSKYDHKELMSGKESHHCYGKGYTDTADWDTCIKKDKLIYNVLSNLRNYGINFKIITPTKYGEFYDSSRLHI